MGVLSDEDLVAMRARARHRLFGALALVMLLVVGVPVLFDHRDVPAPAGDSGESGHAADSRPSPALPDSVAAPGTPAGPAAPATASADAAKPGTTGAAPDALPPKLVEALKPAAPARTGDAQHEAARPAELAHPQPVPATIPPIDSKAPARHGEHAAAGEGAARPVGSKVTSRETVHQAQAGSEAKDAKTAAEPRDSHETHADSTAPHGWFVQFGMFAEAARAETLRQHLDAEGIHVHQEIVHGPRGRFTLVRAGPFPSRASADEVLARARGLGENAFLGHQ